MGNYFDSLDDGHKSFQPVPSKELIRENFVPIIPRKESSWKVNRDPNRLVKTFVFKSLVHQQNFISDLLDYEDDYQHNAEIKIAGKEVTIVIYTHYLNDVTEMDKEYAQTADEIYKDSYVTDDE